MEGGDWPLLVCKRISLLTGLSDTNKASRSKDRIGANDRCWTLVSQGGAKDGEELELALGEEYDHGYDCSKIFY